MHHYLTLYSSYYFIGCSSGWVLYSSHCVPYCPEGTFASPMEKDTNSPPSICLPCHYTCQQCSGPYDFECTSCHKDAGIQETKVTGLSIAESRCLPIVLLRQMSNPPNPSPWFKMIGYSFLVCAIILATLVLTHLIKRPSESFKMFSKDFHDRNSKKYIKISPDEFQIHHANNNKSHGQDYDNNTSNSSEQDSSGDEDQHESYSTAKENVLLLLGQPDQKNGGHGSVRTNFNNNPSSLATCHSNTTATDNNCIPPECLMVMTENPSENHSSNTDKPSSSHDKYDAMRSSQQTGGINGESHIGNLVIGNRTVNPMHSSGDNIVNSSGGEGKNVYGYSMT